jgi:hypothetical protein
MAPSPRRVDLRLTIPAVAPYDGVAGELAGKFAEYSGAEAGAAEALARAVEAAIAPIAAASPHASVELELSARAGRLVVTINAESATQLTCPLPD